MVIPNHIRTRFPHTEPVDKERRSHKNIALCQYLNSYIGDEEPGTRPRKFSVAIAAFQSLHPSPQPHHVIVNEHHFLFRIPFRKVCGRNYVSGIDSEKLQPLI